MTAGPWPTPDRDDDGSCGATEADPLEQEGGVAVGVAAGDVEAGPGRLGRGGAWAKPPPISHPRSWDAGGGSTSGESLRMYHKDVG